MSSTTGLVRPDASVAQVIGPAQFPCHRSLTIYVTGGLDGVLRVVTLLRARTYKVRDLGIEVREGVVESRVWCTALLTADDTDLLLSRLRRLPPVVSAERS